MFMLLCFAPARASRRSASGLRPLRKRVSASQRPSATSQVLCSSRAHGRVACDIRKIRRKIDLDGMMIFSGALCSGVLSAHCAQLLRCARACRSRDVRLLGRHHVAGNVQQGVRGDKRRRNGDVRSSGARRRSRLFFRTHFCRNDGERIRRRSQKKAYSAHIFPGTFSVLTNFYKTQKGEKLISKSGRIRMINPCSAALIYLQFTFAGIADKIYIEILAFFESHKQENENEQEN